MFDTIAGHYDVLNRVNSLGMDRYWRRRCVDALDLPVGSLVLDVACGTGDLCDELARRHMQPVGLDLSSGMLAQARRRGAGGEGGRLDSSGAAPLVLGDALTAPFRPGSFDGSVSAFALRNVVDLGELFRELARLVRPAGRVSLLDLGKPEGRLLRFGHGLWTNHAVPFVGSLFSDGDAYRYLPKSLAYLPAPEQVVGLLEEAGWKAVERLLLAGGTSQIYVATRAGRP
jgi:demethylmenaquinone methyltransferase/2-methoxy-6-polyprenyl-1,4-benzoquinol methylase